MSHMKAYVKRPLQLILYYNFMQSIDCLSTTVQWLFPRQSIQIAANRARSNSQSSYREIKGNALLV